MHSNLNTLLEKMFSMIEMLSINKIKHGIMSNILH